LDEIEAMAEHMISGYQQAQVMAPKIFWRMLQSEFF
jgi:hypothetical protein